MLFHSRVRLSHDRLAYCFRKHSFVNGWELCRDEIEEYLKRLEQSTPGHYITTEESIILPSFLPR